MTESQGLKRLAFRFESALKTPNKSFKIYQEDIEAIQAVGSFIEDKHKKQIIDYQLFGKMYVYLYGEFVNYYKGDVFSDIPQKELHKLLSKPLRSLVQEVTDRLNMSELENTIVETKSLDNYSPMQYDEVAANLKVMINSAIREYSPKHLGNI